MMTHFATPDTHSDQNGNVATIRLVRHDTDNPTLNGPAANERLTAWAGSVLLVLLAVEGVTILSLRLLLIPHVVVGLMLVGPLLVKLASTGYRFVRYYTGDREYVAAGPPMMLLRLLAPLLVVATLFVLGTGISLLFVPPTVRDVMVFLHKAGFVVWFGLTAVHVLAYLWRVPRLIGADLSAGSPPAARRGRAGRLAGITGGILFGVVVASLLVQRAQPWIEVLRHHHDH